MWKKLKFKTKMRIFEGAAIVSLGGFFASAFAIEHAEVLTPFWCALAFLGSLWFFAFLAGWLD